MVEGRACRGSAAAAGQGAGGGHPGGAEQTPAVHVLHTQIRPGGAAAGEETTNISLAKLSHLLEESALYLTDVFGNRAFKVFFSVYS